MIHELLNEHVKSDDQLVKEKKLLIEKASKVIAISHNTKHDILKLYPHINEDKIEVVYLSQSIDDSKEFCFDLPKNYILFVGNRSTYKNFNFFIESLAKLLLKRKDLFVVCAGGGKFDAQTEIFIKSLGIDHKVIQRDFKDDQLYSYYKNALCFVFPSRYEGFGIPVLESMKSACPVVLPKHSSFIEVAGDAALYFKLDDKADLENKVSQLIDNEDLRQSYVEKGTLQASKFSWDKMATETFNIYKSVIH